MKTFLAFLVCLGSAFAQGVPMVYTTYMDRQACIRMETLTGFHSCTQNVMVMAADAAKTVTGFDIIIEYVDAGGVRRKQSAFVRAARQDEAMVGSARFSEVDDITELRVTVISQTEVRR